jgi:hypothetical protein
MYRSCRTISVSKMVRRKTKDAQNLPALGKIPRSSSIGDAARSVRLRRNADLDARVHHNRTFSTHHHGIQIHLLYLWTGIEQL